MKFLFKKPDLQPFKRENLQKVDFLEKYFLKPYSNIINLPVLKGLGRITWS